MLFINLAFQTSMQLAVRFLCLGLTLVLSACSVLQSDKVDYKSNSNQAPSLEVPPDLTKLSRETRYAVPGASVTASGFQSGQATTSQAPDTAVVALGDVRIERSGTQRWLVVDRPADQLWELIKAFWQENGFSLVMDQATLGIMETDWAENRAKIPQDFIRNTLGKIFDSLYSTGERDKFRTRLERNAAGGTDIFISHRGMGEVFSTAEKDKTMWQPRISDPELEAEFLSRLMVKLGVVPEQSKKLLASGATPTSSRVVMINGQSAVQIDDAFDRAWRRVGLALDRSNFTVEDRDRAKGLYFVRYVAPMADKTDRGFFGSLFGQSKPESVPQKFRITVASQGETTTVSVLNAEGASPAPEDAARIVKLIADDLQ